MVAVILGTGTNACYVERVDAIPKLQDHASSSGSMVCKTFPNSSVLCIDLAKLH